MSVAFLASMTTGLLLQIINAQLVNLYKLIHWCCRHSNPGTQSNTTRKSPLVTSSCHPFPEREPLNIIMLMLSP